MDHDNPYAVQEVIPPEPIAVDGLLPEVRRLLAIALAFASVAGSMVYAFRAGEVQIRGPWLSEPQSFR